VDWQSIRARFPGTDGQAYFNAASVGLPCAAGLAAADAARDALRAGASDLFAHRGPALQRSRELLAQLFAVTPAEIGLTTSASRAMDFVAALLERGPRRQIVMARDEFPASAAPWHARGFEVRFVAAGRNGLTADDYAAAVGPETAAIVASLVQFADSTRIDPAALAALARMNGARCVLNVTQAAGAVPVDLPATGADFAIGAAMKYLCSGPGAAYWWCPRHLIERYGAPWGGWMGLEDAMRMDPRQRRFKEDASVVEGGCFGHIPFAVMNPTLELIEELGVDRIQARVRDVMEPIWQWADQARLRIRTPRDPARRGAHVALEVDDPDRWRGALDAQGIRVSARRSALRIAPHLYTDLSDVDRLIAAARTLAT